MLSLGAAKCGCSTVVKWATPGLILALLPKCPLCIAAYIAVATGIGVSVTTATYIRAGAMALCVAAILVLLSRLVRGRAVHQQRF